MSSFRLPAEWEPQTGVLICWPTATTDWSENLADAEKTYLALTTAITRLGKAYVCCADQQTRLRVEQLCTQAGLPAQQVTILQIPYNDTWTRDFGPISVVDDGQDGISWMNFEFNAWGGKYPCATDNQLTRKLHASLFSNTRKLVTPDIVLEGGSIDCDGQGTILTTSNCLLSTTRNPGLGRKEIEEQLFRYLGASRVLWLDDGHLAGDDTDAHIDTLARFCSPDTIAYVQCTDPGDIHFQSLTAMEKELEDFRQVNGQPYRLIPLPLPTACYNKTGDRLPATYANFLILNGSVLVPVYGLETDAPALSQMQKAFPAHELVAINCRPLIEQYGSLHCVTMQIL